MVCRRARQSGRSIVLGGLVVIRNMTKNELYLTLGNLAFAGASSGFWRAGYINLQLLAKPLIYRMISRRMAIYCAKLEIVQYMSERPL